MVLNGSSMVNHHRLRLRGVPDHHPSKTSNQPQGQVRLVGNHGSRDLVGDPTDHGDVKLTEWVRSSICCVVKIVYLGDLAKGDFTCM